MTYVVEKKPEHCMVSCIVPFTKQCRQDWNELKALFMCLDYWVAGNQKTSNVMDHAILSIVIAYSVINDCMYLYDYI